MTKRKIVLIITASILALLAAFTVFDFVVLSSVPDNKTIDGTQVRTGALLNEDDSFAYSAVSDGKYYVYGADNRGEITFRTEMPSAISMISSYKDGLYVGSNRKLFVLTKDGEIVQEAELDFDAVCMDIDEAGENAVVVARYKVNDNQVYFYGVGAGGALTEVNDVIVNKEITQVAAGENGEFFIGTGTQVLKAEKKGGIYSVGAKSVIDAENAFEGICFYNGKIYLADNRGYLCAYDRTERGFILSERIKYGQGSSLINKNSAGLLVVSDYLGNAMVYSLSENKTVAKFDSPTSNTGLSINDGGKIAVIKGLAEVVFYPVGKLPLYSFCKNVKIALIIVDCVALACFVVSVFACFEKSRKKLVKTAEKINKSKVVYLYLFPVFALLILFCYYPVVRGLTLSFQDYMPGIRQNFVGLNNFIELFGNTEFWKSFGNMTIFLVADILKAVIPPILVAETMHAMISKKMQYWARFIMYIPGILPGVAATLLWKDGILGTDGAISQVFGMLGVEKFSQWAWLGNDSTAKWSLIFMSFPWVGQYLIYYGALASVPSSIYEAAELEGCSWFKRIIAIDMPMIMAQIKYILVTTFISSIQNFSRVYLTTNGAFDTNIPALELYNSIQKHQNYGAAATMGFVLFVIIFFISFRQLKGNLKEEG